MNTIDFESNLGKTQAAFIALWAQDGEPWKGYGSPERDVMVPTCLMLNRADGAIGFVGGKAEEEETLKEAATREVEEEIGYKISGDLKPIVAHDIGRITTHLLSLEVSYAELRDIQNNATQSQHFGSEVTGVFLPHLVDYETQHGKGGGISNLLKSSLAPSVREEMVHFLLTANIFHQLDLKIACDRAGFSIDELLK